MLKIHYGNSKFLLPEKWEELNANQFIEVAKLLHCNVKKEIVLLEMALKILLNKNVFRFFMINPDIRVRCHKYVTWIFNEDQKIYTQLLEQYKGLRGPESKFQNLVLEEFHYAEMALYVYKHEKDEDALDQLVAILYREEKKGYDFKKNIDGDARIAFNLPELRYNKKRVRKWDKGVKLAILMWYASCRQLLTEYYPLAFGGVQNTANYYDGLYKTIRGLSGQKYGSFKEVEKINLHLAMKEIVETIWEANELKRKHPELYE